MTEGLIDKVFKKYDRSNEHSKTEYYERCEQCQNILKFKQELIAEIKKYNCYFCERNQYVKNEVWHKHVIQISDLIGDTE